MFSMDSLPGDSGVELVGTMVYGIQGIKGIRGTYRIVTTDK